MADPNYFHRKDFCHAIYEQMASGFAPKLSLFGPRRTGKTQFLLNDLGPKALSFGHRVAYVDLWERGPSALAIILYELDRALQPKSAAGKALQVAQAAAPRVVLSALGQKLLLDLGARPKALPEDQVLMLDAYLERLASAKQRAFLFFDEFQETLNARDHEALLAALRAALTRHDAGLAMIFTGSSQDRLRQVFSRRNAPFYRYTTDIRLPPLGEDFVAFQLGFYPSGAPPVTPQAAMDVFERLNLNPEYFQRWLRRMALSGREPPDQIEALIRAEVEEDQGFAETWLSLAPHDRLILRLIAEGNPAIYGDAGTKAMKKLGVTNPPKKSTRQTAMNNLVRAGLADNNDGTRIVTDPILAGWVLSRPKSDFG